MASTSRFSIWTFLQKYPHYPWCKWCIIFVVASSSKVEKNSTCSTSILRVKKNKQVPWRGKFPWRLKKLSCVKPRSFCSQKHNLRHSRVLLIFHWVWCEEICWARFNTPTCKNMNESKAFCFAFVFLFGWLTHSGCGWVCARSCMKWHETNWEASIHCCVILFFVTPFDNFAHQHWKEFRLVKEWVFVVCNCVRGCSIFTRFSLHEFLRKATPQMSCQVLPKILSLARLSVRLTTNKRKVLRALRKSNGL